ncbi:MAG: AIR synthase [Chloroflexi bacterium]|nr:AIR synthase [Chloroflexota bacterium]
MNEMPAIGKISPQVFEQLILPRLGARSDKILVGPQNGVDVGIVEIGDKAVSLTCDPVFIVPEYGWERSAWFAIHIIASDSVTSGLKPQYLAIDLNLPMEMTAEQLETVWDTMHRECNKLDISVITGHTGRYENCHYPMVGGATMVGIGNKNEYVSPGFARAGDRIIITKGPAIEATGIFATMFPQLIEREFGPDFSNQAQRVFYQMSVVEDAMTAVSVGVREKGVVAMHDATECGIWGGLYEIAQAANLGVRAHKESIVVEDCVPELCHYFDIDPYSSISEGTLIIACREHKAADILKALSSKDIKASVVGEFTRPKLGMVLISEGKERKLEHPIVDPFWRAFYNALEKQTEEAKTS